MLVMVNDLIVHEPAVKRIANRFESTPQRVIGQLFCFSWYVNRYSADDELASLDYEYIAEIFDSTDPEELMEILYDVDFLERHENGEYKLSGFFRCYFVKPPEEDLKNI